jgi:HK97 family phage portal protein
MPWQWPWRRTQDRALWNVGAVPMASTYAGITVNPDSALRLAAVWSCIRLLSATVSGLPVDAYRQGSRTPIDPKPPLLLTPAAYTSFGDWAYQVMVSALTAGNAFGLVTGRSGGALRPSQIELLDPARVTVESATGNGPTWRLDGAEIDSDDLWHFRAYPQAGNLLGLSPIEHAKQAIGLSLAAEKYAAQWFGEGAVPSGVIESDQRLNFEQAQMLVDTWMIRHQGRHKPAVLGAAKYRPISVAPNESQFLDAQRFTVQQIARIYGVAPEMIGADSGNAMTYTNLEQRSLDFLTYGVGPWLGRLETALTDLLPRGTYVKFNTGALLRTDLKSRYESYKLALEGGWLTLEEIRELEDREPLPAAQPGGVA